MEISAAVLERMAQAHQATLSTVQIAAEAAATDFFYALDGVDDEAQERWNAGLWIITLAAATAIAGATRSYMGNIASYTSISIPLPPIDLDWLEDDFAVWADTPIIKARTYLSDEEAFAQALQDAGGNIRKQMSAVTRTTEQNSFDQIVNSAEWEGKFDYTGERPPRPVTATFDTMDATRQRLNSEGYPTIKSNGRAFRWARMPQGGACGWCRVVADRRYSDKSQQKNPMGAWHTFCRCSWRQLTPEESRGWENQYDDDWQDVIKERADAPATAVAGEPT